LESKVTIDTSTLERIAYDPQTILENEEAFWEEEKPADFLRVIRGRFWSASFATRT
jgi:hypothetical protein